MSVLQGKEAVMGAGVKPSPFISSDHQNRAEIETDLAGMRPELYQRVLREVSEQVRLADGVVRIASAAAPIRRTRVAGGGGPPRCARFQNHLSSFDRFVINYL
jgi:hypothetical protein